MYQFDEARLDQNIRDFQHVVRFFEDFFAVNGEFVPEAQNFISALQGQLLLVRDIAKVTSAETIFFQGAVLIPTVKHVLNAILVMELWSSINHCNSKRQDPESCQKVRDIVQENAKLKLFANLTECVGAPEGSKCSEEWRRARQTLQQKLAQFTSLFRDIIRVQLKRYRFNHKPLAKEELTNKYNPQRIESQMTAVADNLMKHVEKRNSELMTHLLPLLSQRGTGDLKAKVEKDQRELQNLEDNLKQYVNKTFQKLKKSPETSDYLKPNEEDDLLDVEMRLDRLDRDMDQVFADIDNIYMRVDTMQEILNRRLSDFADMIDTLEDSMNRDRAEWDFEKTKLQEQIQFMRQEEDQANMALVQTMEMMQGQSNQRYQELQSQQRAVEQKIRQLQEEQELQGGVMEAVIEGNQNRNDVFRTVQEQNLDRDRLLQRLMTENTNILTLISREKATIEQKLRDDELQVERLRSRLRTMETQVQEGQMRQQMVVQNVAKLKKTFLKNQAFLLFLGLLGILVFIWYNWEENCTTQCGFFELGGGQYVPRGQRDFSLTQQLARAVTKPIRDFATVQNINSARGGNYLG